MWTGTRRSKKSWGTLRACQMREWSDKRYTFKSFSFPPTAKTIRNNHTNKGNERDTIAIKGADSHRIHRTLHVELLSDGREISKMYLINDRVLIDRIIYDMTLLIASKNVAFSIWNQQRTERTTLRCRWSPNPWDFHSHYCIREWPWCLWCSRREWCHFYAGWMKYRVAKEIYTSTPQQSHFLRLQRVHTISFSRWKALSSELPNVAMFHREIMNLERKEIQFSWTRSESA